MKTLQVFLGDLYCRRNGFKKILFLLNFPLYFHWNLRKEKCRSFSPSAQWDIANLKSFNLGMGFLALRLVGSISKGIKRPICVQGKKENSPFCCCLEAEMEKPRRQTCPVVTSLLRWPPKLICLMAMVLPHVTISMEKPRREPESALVSFPCVGNALGHIALL